MDVLIIMNNYFHDVATAVLLSSAVIMWVLGRNAELAGAEGRAALARAYPLLTKFAIGALAWIVLGGIPRTIFFKTHEFIPAVDRGLDVALYIKHTLMFAAVVAGILLWRRVRRIIESSSSAAA